MQHDYKMEKEGMLNNNRENKETLIHIMIQCSYISSSQYLFLTYLTVYTDVQTGSFVGFIVCGE